jgi:tetratricopeptide (TPR) repeat protein
MARPAEMTLEIDRYEGYVRADPGNPLLWMNLGNLYHQLSRFDEAIACFERCLHDHPEFSSARSGLAAVMISQHRFADAERVLRGLLTETNGDPALLFNLGISLYYQKRWPDAERAFSDAHARGLTTPESYAYRARCRHYAGDMEQAIRLCQQWVEAAGANDTESSGYLALLYMDQGDLTRARKVAEQVLLASPENVHAGLVMGTASIEAQEIVRAGEQFERILAREPDNARAWLGIGLARLYQQRHEEAIVALDKAVQLIPDSVGIRVTLGWATLVARDVVRAEQIFRDALEVDRNFGEAHGGLASALAMQTRIDEARAAIKLARRLDPRGFGSTFAQTVILKLQGKDQAATDILAGLLQQAPSPDGTTLIEQIEIFTRKNPVRGGTPAGNIRNGERR